MCVWGGWGVGGAVVGVSEKKKPNLCVSRIEILLRPTSIFIMIRKGSGGGGWAGA